MVHRIYAFARTPLSFRVITLGKVIVKSGSRESFPIKMDYEEEPIENRNCNFITRGGKERERGRGERRNIFQREIVLNVSIRFAIVVGHCRFIVEQHIG